MAINAILLQRVVKNIISGFFMAYHPHQGFFQTFKNGTHYMRSWPIQKKLNSMLPENRMILATRFAIRYVPPIVIFIVLWQFHFRADLGPIVATAIFALSLPFQGLWWLGRRATQPLPPNILQWYLELKQKLINKHVATSTDQTLPTFQNLADLLSLALKKSPDDFFDSL